MTLSDCKTIGFIPSTNLETSRKFYTGVLGLNEINADEYAIEYALHKAKLRIAGVNEAPLASYTVFGWEVTDIDAVVDDLAQKGVSFVIYEGMSQNDVGIATFPNGGEWFGLKIRMTMFCQSPRHNLISYRVTLDYQ